MSDLLDRLRAEIATWQKERADCEAEMAECRKDPNCFQADQACDECAKRDVHIQLLSEAVERLQPAPSDDEIETLRMQLAACTTAAIGNTPATVARRIQPGHPYYSASYRDVCDAVDREMALRARLQPAQTPPTREDGSVPTTAELIDELRITTEKLRAAESGWLKAEQQAWQTPSKYAKCYRCQRNVLLMADGIIGLHECEPADPPAQTPPTSRGLTELTDRLDAFASELWSAFSAGWPPVLNGTNLLDRAGDIRAAVKLLRPANPPAQTPDRPSEILKDIINAYDAYRGKGVMPAPEAYAAMVAAIESGRCAAAQEWKA